MERIDYELIERLRVSGNGYRSLSERQVIERILMLANMSGWGEFAAVYDAFELNPGTVIHHADTSLPSIEKRAAKFLKLGADSMEHARALAEEERAKSLHLKPAPITAKSDLALTFEDEEAGASWRRLLAVDYAQYQSVQRSLVDALRIISRGLIAARRQLGPVISKQLPKLVIVTSAEFRDSKLILKPHPYIPDIETACAYAIGLLLDNCRPIGDKRTFGDRLRQCALGADEGEACGRWFLSFASDSGGPMPKYCCPAHRLAAAAATGGTRVRRHRARASAARKK